MASILRQNPVAAKTKQNPTDDSVTLMIFKDQHVARTFQIPTDWMSRLGVLLGIGLLIVASSLFFAVKFYRLAMKADPTQILTLEKELEFSRQEINRLQVVSSPSSSSSPETSTLFGLTTDIKILSPSIQPPIEVANFRTNWVGDTLEIQFNFQYALKDGGNQQGRFFIIAKGHGTLRSYPVQLFNWANPQMVLSAEKGEYFSVRRIRPTTASFGGLGKNMIQSVLIVVVDTDRRLILSQDFAI